MVIRIEQNMRLGRGFQLRFLHDGVDKTFDEDLWDLGDALACAGVLVDMVNKELHTAYKASEVVTVAEDTLEASAKTDFLAARMLQDIRAGKFELSIPARADVKTEVIDGKAEQMLSGRGVVLLAYFSWLDEKLPKAREALTRYCQYIASFGYRGGASAALADLDALEKDSGTDWIKRTFARYVHDERTAINYILVGA